MRTLLSLVITIVVTGSAVAGAKKWPTEGNPVPVAISTDATYGFTEKNPVRVGQKGGGPTAEKAYLNALRGPHGEVVVYKRLGSCCFFETPNGVIDNKAMLDKFELTYVGLEKPVVLYIDFYDYEQPLIPVGFTKAS